jgi:DNA polymerase-1
MLSKRLATIDLNSPIQFDATRFNLDPMNKEKLKEIFLELEFRTLAQQILGNDSVSENLHIRQVSSSLFSVMNKGSVFSSS